MQVLACCASKDYYSVLSSVVDDLERTDDRREDDATLRTASMATFLLVEYSDDLRRWATAREAFVNRLIERFTVRLQVRESSTTARGDATLLCNCAR